MAAIGIAAMPGDAAWAQAPNRSAQRFYPDSSDPAKLLLRTAADHVRGRQWSEALQMYQKVIDQYGNKVRGLRG
jgi:hypothetical protein